MTGSASDSPARAAADAGEGAFAARALDWPAVRALLSPYAASELGRRALLELAPRGEAGARAALARAREVQRALERGDEPPLAGGPDPLAVLADARRHGRVLSGEELAAVAALLRLAGVAGRWLAARADALTACAALWEELPDLEPLRARLEAAVDRRGEVQDGASPHLAELRGAIAALEQRLDGLLRDLARRPAWKAYFADGHAGRVLRRGGRRVLALRQKHGGRVPGIVHDHSQSGETVYVEPRAAVPLGNALATRQADAERELHRVLSELTREVLAAHEPLADTSARLAELELALVSARFGRATGGRPARLPGEEGAAGGLLLRGWRHPLLLEEERAGHIERVVPIDLRLGEAFDLLVITGPNTGGKTLALKGAGLAALLTRLGLAVPAEEGSTVPLYDGVVADIGDEQEIQQNLSTFSSHLVRIRAGLARATPRTLVLLDELGGGTDPDEGAALGEAILERLLQERVPTLASTHLGKLKEIAFRSDRAENAHVEFDPASLAPRFRLVIGAPGESRALAVARGLGLDPRLVDRAEQRLQRGGAESERLMEEMRRVRLDAERLRGDAEGRLVELEERAATFAREEARLRDRHGQLGAEAQRDLEERVARARPWLARARALLAQLERSQRPALEEALAGLEAALEGASLTERRTAFLAGLKKGDLVWVPRFKKRCKVLRLFRERGEVVVRMGVADLTVPMEDVTFYETL